MLTHPASKFQPLSNIGSKIDEEPSETVEVIVEKDVEIGIENVIEKSIGNMVSVKAKAIQELGERLEVLEDGHKSLSGT